MTFENELTFLTYQEEGNEDKFHQSFDDAVEAVRAELGQDHPLRIAGENVETGDTFTVTSPADTDLVIGQFASGTEDDVDEAVAAAHDAFDGWRKKSYEERAEIFEKAADIMRDRRFELAATLSLENGKNRTEAMADVDEAIDFLAFYSQEIRRHKGYVYDTGEPSPGQHCTNLLRPYGVFGVIAPFNFPLAILVGMTTGALITGNTAVVKPASATPMIAHKVFDILDDAGVPDGVANLVTGGGRDVGQPLVEHEDVKGLVFTGSREVGLQAQETFIEMGKRGPVIAELGGKNSVIVSNNADLDKAVNGVMKGAFSFSGQKCSATSRVYVHEDIYDTFVAELVDESEELVVGEPWGKETFVSPVIDDKAIERYHDIVAKAESDGTIQLGGNLLEDDDLPEGRYVEPTIVTDLPHEHELATEEHFLPFVTIHKVSDFEEALAKANDSDYALCAGLFTEDGEEVTEWLDKIESGMCYVNRHQSATTGALVQGQPFGGWKFSGTTGTFAGGYWYLPQFMREQSRTIVKED